MDLRINIPDEDLRRRQENIRHVYFDVDGTLINDTASGGSVWAKIHSIAGIGSDVREARCTEHRKGDLSYDQWMSQDIGDWQRAGVTIEQIRDVIRSLQLVEGARETIETLRQRGYSIGIISSSIDLGILSLLPEALFDELSINRIIFNDLGLISGWSTSACRLAEKGERLKSIARERNVEVSSIAFVGNDYNDVGAAKVAGLSIAVNCIDDELKSTASVVCTSTDLTRILSLFPGRSISANRSVF